jgi:hypothetical protein
MFEGWVANTKYPNQHKFEQSGIDKGMEIVGVVPVPPTCYKAGL